MIIKNGIMLIESTKPYKIGIVGSRKRIDKQTIIDIVNLLPKNYVVVSGGCRGVDTWAEIQAKKIGLKTIIFKPDLKDIECTGDMINRYYMRNKKIVEESDMILAFVNKERTGGTENTITWAKKLDVPVLVIT